MKRLITFLFSTALVGVIATPAFAQDSPRFTEDEKFLEEWNAFLEEEKNNAKQDQVSVDLNFNLTDKAEEEEDFIYFKPKSNANENTPGVKVNAPQTDVGSFTPRQTTLSTDLQNIVLPGDAWLLSTFTPRNAAAHLKVGIGSRSTGFGEQTTSLFDISVESVVSSIQPNTFGTVNTLQLGDALRRQIYNFGVNVGYSGFQVGASIQGEEGAFFDGISGYDVGVAYQRDSWSTKLLVGEYRFGNNYMLGLNDPLLNDRFFAVEFGATYNLSPWFKVVGTYRLYEDANLMVFNLDSVNTSQMFFLGTNVSF